MDKKFDHYSVMKEQCLEALCVRGDGVYVDMTVGGGGHALAVAQQLTTGTLIGIDRDADAIHAAGARLAGVSARVILVKDNYKNIKKIVYGLGFEAVDGILCDMGVSSYQLDSAERGFSYHHDAPLDMRMDRDAPFTAYTVVNEYPLEKLSDILFRYGEEKNARRIAARIVSARSKKPVETTLELAEIVKSAFPAVQRFADKHPAKRTFQAIRIEVNDELKDLEKAFEDAVDLLAPGGRIAVMTFHSLEDRIVKNTFRRLSQGCTCDKNLPVCVCGNRKIIKLINRKPISADERELVLNKRSRPAKLRIGEKLQEEEK